MALHPFSDEFDAEVHPQPGMWHPMSSSRVQQARYDRGLRQIQVIFKDGTPWVYDQCEASTWHAFLGAASPGRFINSDLNGKPYWHGAFDTTDGSDVNEV